MSARIYMGNFKTRCFNTWFKLFIKMLVVRMFTDACKIGCKPVSRGGYEVRVIEHNVMTYTTFYDLRFRVLSQLVYFCRAVAMQVLRWLTAL